MHEHTIPTDKKLIRQSELIKSLSLSSSGFHRLKKIDPEFPKPIKFGSSRYASAFYVMSEIEQWLLAKMEARGVA